ncbi:hypothetical protein JOF56_003009 [Kibdelosporangium banguiense]|uniref:Apea-like HEPN domain-containing protein n=1 Tax=Kibdelosporangium banguiense TaxID=1365924 RepID=A0ABS4TE48_9PSEU|nr:hypothetical protein [Kibdelosporangium banguiense]MBP2322624.1 hypothetical protein [Kibdelosporangium banguiense]
MSILMERLEEPQLELLNIVWPLFSEHQKFPVYNYVDYQMRKLGLDAREVIRSFPSIGLRGYRGRYSAIWTDQIGTSALQSTSPICLTMAGLFHIKDDRARQINDILLKYLRDLSAARAEIADHPFDVPDVKVLLSEPLKEAGDGPTLLPWVVAIAEHEWPSMSIQRDVNRVTGQLGSLLMEANFSTVDEYLNAITAATTPQEPPSILERRDPRALARTITNFDITCELVLDKQLVRKPAIDRTALFVQAAATFSDLQAGLSALGELLSELQVPGDRPRHPSGRLLDYLVQKLTSIDQGRVQEAIKVMDAVREIRNSGQHTRPSAKLIDAHDLLGLPFPLHDPTWAWDVVRAQMDAAFSLLQEEIYAAR